MRIWKLIKQLVKNGRQEYQWLHIDMFIKEVHKTFSPDDLNITFQNNSEDEIKS
ncbi:hypothetical protein STEG23_017105, partial [Scotinomys teguina]